MTEWGNVIGTFLALLLMLVILPWIYEKCSPAATSERHKNNTTDIISNCQCKRKAGDR